MGPGLRAEGVTGLPGTGGEPMRGGVCPPGTGRGFRAEPRMQPRRARAADRPAGVRQHSGQVRPGPAGAGHYTKCRARVMTARRLSRVIGWMRFAEACRAGTAAPGGVFASHEGRPRRSLPPRLCRAGDGSFPRRAARAGALAHGPTRRCPGSLGRGPSSPPPARAPYRYSSGLTGGSPGGPGMGREALRSSRRDSG